MTTLCTVLCRKKTKILDIQSNNVLHYIITLYYYKRQIIMYYIILLHCSIIRDIVTMYYIILIHWSIIGDIVLMYVSVSPYQVGHLYTLPQRTPCPYHWRHFPLYTGSYLHKGQGHPAQNTASTNTIHYKWEIESYHFPKHIQTMYGNTEVCYLVWHAARDFLQALSHTNNGRYFGLQNY